MTFARSGPLSTYVHVSKGTTTISLADDAYERLKAAKREGESFSDVVRRLTAGVDLVDVPGTLSPETAAALEAAIDDRRDRHGATRSSRQERVTEAIEDGPE